MLVESLDSTGRDFAAAPPLRLRELASSNGLDAEDYQRRRGNAKGDGQGDHADDASERRRRHQGMGAPPPTFMELPGNYGYPAHANQVPPPSRWPNAPFSCSCRQVAASIWC